MKRLVKKIMDKKETDKIKMVNNFGDGISKLLLSLITAALIAGTGLLISLNNKDAVQNNDIKYIKEALYEIRDRNDDYLTKQDFDTKMQTIINQVNQNSNEISKEGDNIRTTNENLTELDFRVRVLEKKHNIRKD